MSIEDHIKATLANGAQSSENRGCVTISRWDLHNGKLPSLHIMTHDLRNSPDSRNSISVVGAQIDDLRHLLIEDLAAECDRLRMKSLRLEADVASHQVLVAAARDMRKHHEGCITEPPCGSCVRCDFDRAVDELPPASPF